MGDDQETISEHVRKIIEDCKKSTGRVSLSEQGHLIIKFDRDNTGADLPSLARQYFGDQQLGYMLVPTDRVRRLRESSVMIFIPKKVNDDEQDNSSSTRLSQRLTPTNAENAHNDPKLHEGSTNDEHPLHNQRLEIDALRQEELNLQHGLDNAKASIKVLQADLEAIQAHMERQQTILEAHQGILKPGQTRLAIVQARLAVRYARLSVANNTESDMS